MKSKEEIITPDDIWNYGVDCRDYDGASDIDGINGINDLKELVYTAMSTYAEEVAREFGEWLLDYWMNKDDLVRVEHDRFIEDGEVIHTQDLYQLFLTEKGLK